MHFIWSLAIIKLLFQQCSDYVLHYFYPLIAEYFFLFKTLHIPYFQFKMFPIINMYIKHFGSQMRPYDCCGNCPQSFGYPLVYMLWGLIWIHIVCKGHQWSSKIHHWRERVIHQYQLIIDEMTGFTLIMSSLPSS